MKIIDVANGVFKGKKVLDDPILKRQFLLDDITDVAARVREAQNLSQGQFNIELVFDFYFAHKL